MVLAILYMSSTVHTQERHAEMKLWNYVLCETLYHVGLVWNGTPACLFTCFCCIAVALDKGRGGSSHDIRPLLMCSLKAKGTAQGPPWPQWKGCTVPYLCVSFHCFCCLKGGVGAALAWQDEETAIHLAVRVLLFLCPGPSEMCSVLDSISSISAAEVNFAPGMKVYFAISLWKATCLFCTAKPRWVRSGGGRLNAPLKKHLYWVTSGNLSLTSWLQREIAWTGLRYQASEESAMALLINWW